MRLLSVLVLTAAGSGCSICSQTDELCLVGSELAEAYLSVQALGTDDVWLVGSEQESGVSGPAVQHFDGQDWNSMNLSSWAGSELWWSHPSAARVIMVGTDGLILELDRSSGEVLEFDGPPAELTFFGVWGAEEDDVWAVGGDTSGVIGPQIWRRDAAGWSQYIDPAIGEGSPGQIYFKVHGRAADDLWIVGNVGLALHWDGSQLTQTPTGEGGAAGTSTLSTVDVGPEGPVAVGGDGNGLILHWDGSAWQDRSPPFQPSVNGVCSGGEADRLVSVGRSGSLQEWNGSEWVPQLETLTLLDYHACDVSPDGAIWAVGGKISSRPLVNGVVAYAGTQSVPELTGE